MPTKVHLSDLGIDLEFPDTMSQDAIAAAIQNNKLTLQGVSKAYGRSRANLFLSQQAQEQGVPTTQMAGPGTQVRLAPPVIQQGIPQAAIAQQQAEVARRQAAHPYVLGDVGMNPDIYQGEALPGIAPENRNVPLPPNSSQVLGASLAGQPLTVNSPQAYQSIEDKIMQQPGTGQQLAQTKGFLPQLGNTLGSIFLEPQNWPLLAAGGSLIPPAAAAPLILGTGAYQGTRYGLETGDWPGAAGQFAGYALPLGAGKLAGRIGEIPTDNPTGDWRGPGWGNAPPEVAGLPQGRGPTGGTTVRPSLMPEGVSEPPPPPAPEFTPGPRRAGNYSNPYNRPEPPRGPVVTEQPLSPGDVIETQAGSRLVVHSDNGGTLRLSFEGSDQPPVNVARGTLYGRPVSAGAGVVPEPKVSTTVDTLQRRSFSFGTPTVREVWNEGANDYLPVLSYPINDSTGESVGIARIVKEGNVAHVDWIGEQGDESVKSAKGPLSDQIGVPALRKMVRQLIKDYPDIDTITGYRIGGSNFRGSETVTVSVARILGRGGKADAVQVGSPESQVPGVGEPEQNQPGGIRQMGAGDATRPAPGTLAPEAPAASAPASQAAPEVAQPQQSPEIARFQQILATPRAETEAKLTHEAAAVNLVKQGVPLPPQAASDYPHLAGLAPESFGKPVPPELARAYADALAARDMLPTEPTLQQHLSELGRQIVAHQQKAPKVKTTVKKQIEKVNNQGFTKSQQSYLALELENAKADLSQPDSSPVTIHVPGDGTFTVSTPGQAEKLQAEVKKNPALRREAVPPVAESKLTPSPWEVPEQSSEAMAVPKGWEQAEGMPAEPTHEGYVTRMGRGKNAGRVYVTRQTAQAITQALTGIAGKHVLGANIHPGYVPPLIGQLQVEAERGVPGAAEAARHFQQSAKESGNGSAMYIVARAGMPGAKMIIRHEDVHRAQVNWSGIDLYEHPAFEKAAENLGSRGYPIRWMDSTANALAMSREIGARLVAGQYESMGLSKEEGDSFLEHYVNRIYDSHGPEGVADILRRSPGVRNRYAKDTDGREQAPATAESAAAGGQGGAKEGDSGNVPEHRSGDALQQSVEFALSEPQRQLLDEIRNNVLEGLSGLNRAAPDSADAVIRFSAAPQVANLYMRVKWPQFHALFAGENNYERWQLWNVADAIEALRDSLEAERVTTTDMARRREIDTHLNNLTAVPDPLTGRTITRDGLERYFALPDVQAAGEFYERALYPVMEQARLGSDREANGIRGLYGNHFVPKYAIGEDGKPLPGTVNGAYSYGRRGKTWQIGSVPGDRAFTGKADSYMPDAAAAYELRLRSALKAEGQRTMYKQWLSDGVAEPAGDASLQHYSEGEKGRNGLYMEFRGKEEPAIAFSTQNTRWAGSGQRTGATESDIPAELVMPSRFYNEIDPALELAKVTPWQQMLEQTAQKAIKGFLLGTAEKIYHSSSLNSRLAKMQGAVGDTELGQNISRALGPINSILSVKNVLPNTHSASVRFDAAKLAAENGATPHDFAAKETSAILYGENGVLANAFAELYQRAAVLEGATENANGSYDLSPEGRRAVGLAMRKMNVHTTVQISRLQRALTGRSKGWLATFYQTGSRNRAIALQQPIRFIVAGTLASQLLQIGVATLQDPQHRAPWKQPNWKPGNVIVGKDKDGQPIWSNLFGYADRTQYLAEWPLRSLETSLSNKDNAMHTAENLALDGWNTETEPVFSGPIASAIPAATGFIPWRYVAGDNLKTPKAQEVATAKQGVGKRAVAVAQSVFPLSNVAGPMSESHPIKDPVWYWAGVASRTLGGPQIHKDYPANKIPALHRAAEKRNRAPVRNR